MTIMNDWGGGGGGRSRKRDLCPALHPPAAALGPAPLPPPLLLQVLPHSPPLLPLQVLPYSPPSCHHSGSCPTPLATLGPALLHMQERVRVAYGCGAWHGPGTTLQLQGVAPGCDTGHGGGGVGTCQDMESSQSWVVAQGGCGMGCGT